MCSPPPVTTNILKSNFMTLENISTCENKRQFLTTWLKFMRRMNHKDNLQTEDVYNMYNWLETND